MHRTELGKRHQCSTGTYLFWEWKITINVVQYCLHLKKQSPVVSSYFHCTAEEKIRQFYLLKNQSMLQENPSVTITFFTVRSQKEITVRERNKRWHSQRGYNWCLSSPRRRHGRSAVATWGVTTPQCPLAQVFCLFLCVQMYMCFKVLNYRELNFNNPNKNNVFIIICRFLKNIFESDWYHWSQYLNSQQLPSYQTL